MARPVSCRLRRKRKALGLVRVFNFAAGPATLPVEINAIDARFKAMLALTAAQPEGLTPREIAFLADYLGNLSYALTARNFNPVMAMAADTVIVCLRTD